LEITKSDIVKLIEKRETDSFLNHLVNILKWDYQSIGEVRNREIRIWQQNSWNRMFYPIFKLDLNKDGHLINISHSINSAGKVIYILFLITISIIWLHSIFDDFDLSAHIVQISGWFIFITIFLLISFKVYRMEKKIQLENIYEILDMEIENEQTESEWGWKKILTRLIMYPICLFLIAISFFFIMPTGKIFYMIIPLGIVGVYLYSDLKILLRKKTTGNNGYN